MSMSSKESQISLKVQPDLLARVDRVRAEMSARAGGVEISRAAAARTCMDAGLSLLESEFGLDQGAASEPARSTERPKKRTK